MRLTIKERKIIVDVLGELAACNGMLSAYADSFRFYGQNERANRAEKQVRANKQKARALSDALDIV